MNHRNHRDGTNEPGGADEVSAARDALHDGGWHPAANGLHGRTESMTDLFSIMPVSDRAVSTAWFESFFGRPADDVIGEEAMWQVGASGWIVVDDRRDSPGRGEVTLAVTGLDAILARLAAHGIRHEPVEAYGNGVRHVTVADPDGNRVSLAEPPDAS